MPLPITTAPPVPRPGKAPANNPSLVPGSASSSSAGVEKSVVSEDGQFRTDYYADKKVMVNITTGQVVASKPRRQQYSTPEQQALAASKDVQLTQQNFGKFSTQHRQGDSGTYGNGKDFDWADFKSRHGDWLDQDFQGGFAAFQSAVQSPRSSKTATTWFQNQVNNQLLKEGKPTYFKEVGDTDPNQIDGKFGINTFSVPRFYQPSADVKKEAAPTPAPGAIPGTPTYDQADPAGGKWWAQDIANFAGAMTDKVNKYNPLLQQEHLEVPDYALLDPSRQLASIKEEGSRYAQSVENTSSGQVARANLLGASGESARQAADVLGSYENQNVGISNQASQIAAQTHNQETDINTRLLDKFVGESATVNQQYDNARTQQKYRQLDALNQGITNSQKQTQLEQVFPQVKVDRFSGKMVFSGQGKSLEDDDAYGEGSQTPEQLSSQHASLYKMNLDKGIAAGMTPENAHKFASGQLELYEPKDNKSKAAMAKQMARSMGAYQQGGEVDHPYLLSLDY